SAQTWLNSGRPDWVTVNKGTDSDAVSYGCALLFLNFLRYELKYGWQAIVQTRGIPAGSDIFNRTLAAMYQDLTGFNDSYLRFAGLFSMAFPLSTNALLTTNNPFPLARSGGLMVQGNYGHRETSKWWYRPREAGWCISAETMTTRHFRGFSPRRMHSLRTSASMP